MISHIDTTQQQGLGDLWSFGHRRNQGVAIGTVVFGHRYDAVVE